MRPDRLTQLGDVAFSEYFCTITVFSSYAEYVVRFPLPDGVFLPCDHGLDFDMSLLCESSINQSKHETIGSAYLAVKKRETVELSLISPY